MARLFSCFRRSWQSCHGLYIMGKVEGQGVKQWHGHVTAVTVSPEYRRQQLAKKLMNLVEDVSDKIDKALLCGSFRESF